MVEYRLREIIVSSFGSNGAAAARPPPPPPRPPRPAPPPSAAGALPAGGAGAAAAGAGPRAAGVPGVSVAYRAARSALLLTTFQGLVIFPSPFVSTTCPHQPTAATSA